VYLRRLSLVNFRCYRRLDLTLPGGTVVVAGGNAQGKSSLLEAIYVLATTRSHQTSLDRELVHWDAEEEVVPYSRVWGTVVRGASETTIEVVNSRQSLNGSDERYGKRVRVNNVPKRAMDALGVLNVVLFAPDDLEVVAGPPSARRRYLDVLLCQIDRGYCAALARYNRVLQQRNHLLRRLRDRGGDREELRFWDEQLAADGGRLMAARQAMADRLAAVGRELHDELAGGGPPLELAYHVSVLGEADGARQPALAGGQAAHPASREADRAALASVFATTLAGLRNDEIARGMTLVGPHRDDLSFAVGGVDMRTYGSRGQQRTVTLAIKLAEARVMWAETGERPVLLLDDVLSELDAERRRFLLDQVDRHQQTFLTTTDAEHLGAGFLSEALVLEVSDAAVVGARRAGKPVTPPTG
jgi:DNA replication and repair protein RecF